MFRIIWGKIILFTKLEESNLKIQVGEFYLILFFSARAHLQIEVIIK